MALYLQPDTLDDALSALADQSLTVISGGTDYYPARVGKPIDDDILDISRIAGLRGITEADDHFHFGASTSWTDIIEADLPPWFDGLKLAAREVGGVQIQNAGTIAGNFCNASPAADGIPPLFALDAQVELASARGTQSMGLEKFIMGNRKIRIATDEIVTGLRIANPANPARSTFLKLGARKYLVISIVMVAAVIEQNADGTVAAARIAVGSCSAAAKRLRLLERALKDRPLNEELGDVPEPGHLSILSPITDVRGSADYRQDSALTLIGRTLRELGASA
ncbi:MAG: xanthine dehydrogenase family protein subunit M [Rhodospirillaceae bacterium]|nr:xanthine dehydrogenase family protein subunit M [Rhodospirillaceae bacterium]